MRVADVLTQLLTCAEDMLDPAPCRAFKNPGLNAPHDNCESTVNGNGQVWVAHTGSGSGWPSPTNEPTTCVGFWSESYELGVVRCAMSKLDNDGIPEPAQITADAEMQETDRLALRNAIMCCLVLQGKDLIIERWDSIEPWGGCVGGTWTFSIMDAGCNCLPES